MLNGALVDRDADGCHCLGRGEQLVAQSSPWDAVSVDERWQLEQWGADHEAETALDNKGRDFLAAARFLELLA